MTTNVSYRVIFNRANQLDQNGTAAVLIEAYQNGRRRYFPFGLRLKPAEWDKKKKEVKANPIYNRLIRSRMDELEAFELQFPVQHGRFFTLKGFDLLPERQPVVEAASKISLTEFIKQQLGRERPKIIRATYTRYLLVATTLEDYNAGRPVDFASMTYDFVECMSSAKSEQIGVKSEERLLGTL